MLPQTNQIWPGSSLSIPLQIPQSLRSALERAIYSAHHQRLHSPAPPELDTLTLPHRTHTKQPLRAHNHESSCHMHREMAISSGPSPDTDHKMHIYLVANNKTTPTATQTLKEATHTL